MVPRSNDDYHIGWVCALPKELTAARVMLDEEHELLERDSTRDYNSYVLGRIGSHNVVLVCLATGTYGKVKAASCVSNMLRTFRNLRVGLMVGIGGGIPNLEKEVDIRLGDVVVSRPEGTNCGVVQYDLGKKHREGRLELKGFLRPPPEELLTALANLQSKYQIRGSRVPSLLAETTRRHPDLIEAGYKYQGLDKDFLYCSRCQEGLLPGNRRCSYCQRGMVQRKRRQNTDPKIHYGLIASGDQLIKNVAERDRLGQDLGAKCVEMEAAGVMNEFPCLVVRGISDYADSHKNDVWQEYAAITAAAFAKELLLVVQPVLVRSIPCATDTMTYQRGISLAEAPDMPESLFFGRELEIKKMESILQPKSGSLGTTKKVLVLGGMGGVGKTQLAIMYAKKHRLSYASIFWLNADSKASIRISFRKVARQILDHETYMQLNDDETLELVTRWLSDPLNKQWLLILDNYDNPNQYSIKEYLPYATHGSIVITSRRPDVIIGEQVMVESMTELEDGLRILVARSGRKNARLDADARKVAERLKGYPLALATAGTYLRRSSISFGEYLQLYEDKWQVTERCGELSDYPNRTLFTTWDLSYAEIQQESPRAAQLMKLFGYLDNQDIWYGLFAGAAKHESSPPWFVDSMHDLSAFEQEMQILAKYCLVEIRQQSGGQRSYGLHMCVHDWTLHSLNREIDTRYYRLVLDCISCHLPSADQHNRHLPAYNRITPHVFRLAHARFTMVLNEQYLSKDEFDKVNAMAHLLYEKGYYSTSGSFEWLLMVSKAQRLGPDHPSSLDTMNNLASVYMQQGKLDQAEQLYQQTLTKTKQGLGPDHPLTLSTMNNLAMVYDKQGKLDQAEQLHQQTLTKTKQILGPDHPSTLSTMNNLATVYDKQGKLDQAEQLYQQTLTKKEQGLGPDHPSTLDTMNNLASVYTQQGKLDQAEQLHQQTLTKRKQVLGPDHPSTLATMNKLALVYNKQGKLDQAEQLYQQTLSKTKQGLGPDHPSTLDIMNNLAIVYTQQGKLDQAEQLHQQTLTKTKQGLGPDHPSTLSTMNNLAMVYRQQGKLDQAEQLYQQALAGYERSGLAQTADALETVHNLGMLYAEQGKTREGRILLEQAMSSHMKLLRPQDPSTFECIERLKKLDKQLAGKDIQADNISPDLHARRTPRSGHDNSVLANDPPGTSIVAEPPGKRRHWKDVILRLKRL